MTEPELLKLLEGIMPKNKAENLATVVSSTDSVAELLKFTFYHKPEIAFRAAWVLEHVAVSDFDRFSLRTADFVNRYPEQANQSCRRHYTKIMMLLIKKKMVADLDLTAVVEATFEWLIDPRTPVAVQVNCLEVLFRLRNRHDWIADELKAQAEFLLREGSPAIQVAGKKILRQLQTTT